MTVLILTDDSDQTASRVAVELASRGVPVTQVDPAGFPVRINFTTKIGSGRSWSGALVNTETGRIIVDVADITRLMQNSDRWRRRRRSGT